MEMNQQQGGGGGSPGPDDVPFNDGDWSPLTEERIRLLFQLEGKDYEEWRDGWWPQKGDSGEGGFRCLVCHGWRTGNLTTLRGHLRLHCLGSTPSVRDRLQPPPAPGAAGDGLQPPPPAPGADGDDNNAPKKRKRGQDDDDAGAPGPAAAAPPIIDAAA